GGVPPEAVNEPVIAAPVPAPAVRFDGLAWRVVPDGTTLSGIFAVRGCAVLVSVAVKDTSESPAAVGVPPSEPAAERVTPPGNPDAVHVNDPEPPFALSDCGPYVLPTMPLGSEVVVMESWPKTVIDS